MKASAQKFGATMELMAQQYLESIFDWELCFANWHSRYGEIDLIMKDHQKNSLVLVEVKAARSLRFGTLKERISKSKIQKILKTKYFFEKKEKLILKDAIALTIFLKASHPEVEIINLWDYLGF